MRLSSQNLIWLDLEMTGLDPDYDRIIEIATVITDKHLKVLAEGPVIAVHHSDTILERMDDWNVSHHTKSGLVDRVRMSNIGTKEAERLTLDFLKEYVPPSKSPMCGNSICMDRRFLYRHMPRLEQHFHYRNLDVSTIKILVERWFPNHTVSKTKKSKHQALADIYDSIEELRHYKQHVFKTSDAN
jgi:oligoribonuclease